MQTQIEARLEMTLFARNHTYIWAHGVVCWQMYRRYWIDHQDGHTEMGEDYNHSTFIDLILSGLLGMCASRKQLMKCMACTLRSY